MSVVYRFREMYDLVIVPNDDMSVSFVFWSLQCGNTRFDNYGEPIYEERFG